MKVFLACVAAATIAFTAPAKAGGAAGGGSTEWTQLANNAELIGIYVEQIEGVRQKVLQYQNMVQNTAGLSQQMWPSALVQISDLVDTISAVDSAANSSAQALQDFARQYHHTESMTSAQAIQRWRTGVQNQIAQSLRTAGINANQIRDNQSALAQIQAASQSAQGRMQVMQAGNQISGLMVNEIQSLHMTTIAAQQAKQNYLATNVREREEADEAFREFFRDTGRRF